MQSKKHSFLEAVCNVFASFLISLAANSLLLPAFGYHITLAHNIAIVAIMTCISLTKNYMIRRAFNIAAAKQESDVFLERSINKQYNKTAEQHIYHESH